MNHRLGGGLGVSPGRAAGAVAQMPPALSRPVTAAPLAAADRAAEAARIGRAAASVERHLSDRAAGLASPAREIVLATAMMAADPQLLEDSQNLVTHTGASAELAVWATIDSFIGIFAQNGGPFAERIIDLIDVRDRIACALLGRPAPGIPVRGEPFVLVARDLAPADTVLLESTQCVALVTLEGSRTSHTAILARALGIPAVVCAPNALDLVDGTIIAVDGDTGEIIANPTSSDLSSFESNPPRLTSLAGFGATADGHRVALLANVTVAASVATARDSNAEGVGLYRTEFCFLDRSEAPSIDEQVAAYRTVFAAFPGKRVTVRTLDGGADKPLPFMLSPLETNAALGIRGFRTSWRQPQILEDQLEAIAQAAAVESAVVSVMAPMISTPSEAEDFAARCASHGIELCGVMIETPAAAVMAAEIFRHVAFASLGTNDLAQYTMAADRLVGALAELNDPWQPAVLRMIQLACTAAASADKPIGVCGEAAADPELAIVLVGLGVTSLSMAPRALGAVSEALAATTLADCKSAAAAALAASDPVSARAAARAHD